MLQQKRDYRPSIGFRIDKANTNMHSFVLQKHDKRGGHGLPQLGAPGVRRQNKIVLAAVASAME